MTATDCPLGADSVTTTLAVPAGPVPSVTEPSATERPGGGSSSLIGRVPEPSAMVAPDGEDRAMVKVSGGSSRASVTSAIGTVRVVAPGVKVSVPLAAAKSAGLPAVAAPVA